ncbi:hypothetical protein MELA_00403 [Candidatus Methylomirabilis lanthanidiphila]|uniref:Uncharacterized protein n=1 Tax=Candidatus Methylomirabilis lanthanidiphila TaxID=2211376 RepID=A0A564ZFE6_9BACT|nr:hypothetical protein MELA_00403 [Candidatus Methylomirabilis lanthanidiphila]
MTATSRVHFCQLVVLNLVILKFMDTSIEQILKSALEVLGKHEKVQQSTKFYWYYGMVPHDSSSERRPNLFLTYVRNNANIRT